MTTGNRNEQMGLEEEVVEDDETTELLLRLEKISNDLKPINKKGKPLRDELKAKKAVLNEKYPLKRTNGKRIRIGPFVLEGKINEDSEVNFVRSGTYRVAFKRVETVGE